MGRPATVAVGFAKAVDGVSTIAAARSAAAGSGPARTPPSAPLMKRHENQPVRAGPWCFGTPMRRSNRFIARERGMWHPTQAKVVGAADRRDVMNVGEAGRALARTWTAGGIVVPFAPFCGVIGVAPKETGRLDTIPPRIHGGNLDIRDMGVGSRAWLPVFVEGALFSCGDAHSAQGDGEVSGTAIESPMEATLRLTVVKDRPIKELQFETPRILGASGAAGYHVTTAHGPDLYENAKNSVRAMIDFLVEHHGLTRSQAYVLCSTAVDLKISEIVDAPNWIVSAYLPRSIFRG